MIEVFKTNIREVAEANNIIALLQHHFPGTSINIDLHDCDKVLRVEGDGFSPDSIVRLVKGHGYTCGVLE